MIRKSLEKKKSLNETVREVVLANEATILGNRSSGAGPSDLEFYDEVRFELENDISAFSKSAREKVFSKSARESNSRKVKLLSEAKAALKHIENIIKILRTIGE